ncbi:hypothetical protein GSI_05343 [Ganoderma sinense ZZ0214-1]|uniref:Protein kinase domain-containing protein n=1 Tax=Ganoderma sinense ZZ0214-1 TaxID=1077348 RepID=A0A2G8SFU8_9APHY|nr:hypothetical protein GSI_05343 [Ganoderma sinense ZZ0214-1]
MWDVLHSRYQVVGKLGNGAYSTVWLCRDLVEHCHVTVKVCTQLGIPVERELSALKHLNSLPASEHIGRTFIRTALDHFELPADPKSSNPAPFPCFVYKPMATSLYQFRKLFPQNRFPKQLLKSILQHVLLAIHYLHIEAKMIHADIQEGNILLSLDDPNILEEFEEEEWRNPSPRKIDGDRVVYLSRLMHMHMTYDKYGPPILCDFTEARFGSATYTDLIQPDVYRAPEVILAIPWDEKVDIWSVGVLIWDMFEGTHMFKTAGGPENKYRTVNHLAHMVSLLGPPPVDFLKRTEVDWIPWKYFDKQGEGNWIGKASVPEDSLEQLEENLEGEDKAQFLAFVRKMVTWKPEDRCSIEELLKDPWLN